MNIEGQDRTDLKNALENIHKKDWYLSKSITANCTVGDNDKVKTIYVTTSTNTITITLPTAADNLDRVIEIMKIDSAFDSTGAGSKITVDGEGGETINGQTTIDIEVQYCGIRIKSDGSNWYVLDTIGDCGLNDIGGTLEIVYTKYFTGTTAAGATTNVVHGITMSKMLTLNGWIQQASATAWHGKDMQSGAWAAGDVFRIYTSGVNIVLANVGANLRSKPYAVKLKYYV